jgi:hypothetical protein
MDGGRMNNKWKWAFWICFTLLVATGLIGIYSVVDQAVTLTYMREGYADTEEDLETLITLLESSGQSKSRIEKILSDHRLVEYMNFKSDTISLERAILIFENDTLKSVLKQW